MSEPIITIGICMGSSCFARGNRALSQNLRRALEKEGLTERVLLKGYLCTDACDSGPCVSVNDTRCNGFDVHDIVQRAKQEIAKATQ